MITEELIEFSTAVLAKEKGFNIEQCNYYNSHGQLNESLEDFFIPRFEAPSQSLLQRWLREVHGISTIVDTDVTLSWVFRIQSLHPEATYTGEFMQSNHMYSTYETALEAALQTALKLIV